ncbi:GIY-YIG nuclease family protein [Reinekea blandensis]|uniref:Excinuclease ABC, C subunit-like protein n=1 Tax=Reinekea blandensis MED297 TaxID=314283 RepID=A4B9D9_9GAMM|nr:GIY-YIG nuclease family protein [Reinekea blandensis]EAR11240.1 Excinuclease ABC, C subunit-like protein [Reinekea sp. MED297] [Reinekea blandensis MED297]
MMPTPTPGWWVYFVQCADGTFYTGITTDPHRRLRQHNGELVGGARYTASRRPVTLVFYEPHPSRSDAARAEYRLRKLSRKQKLARIETFVEPSG